jgi:hypothetical protein
MATQNIVRILSWLLGVPLLNFRQFGVHLYTPYKRGIITYYINTMENMKIET